MKLHFAIFSLAILLLAPQYAAGELYAVNNSSGTHLRGINETNLNQVDLDLPLTNIRCVAVGDLITTSPGLEIAVAYGSPSILDVRTANGQTVILTRDFGADAVGVPAGGGPTGFGPETINDIAIGECRNDLPGLEIGVASKGALGGNTTGFARVLNAQSGALADRNGTGAGLNVTAIAVGDLNSRFSGGEIAFCWQYEINGATFNTQVAVFTTVAAGFVGNTIRNIVGAVRPAGLFVGEAIGDGGTPEILVGTDLGELHLFQPSIADAGNPSLLSYQATDPALSLRGGFGDILAVTLGDIQTNPGTELVTYSTDGSTTSGVLRVIDPFSANLGTDLAAAPVTNSNIIGLAAYDAIGSVPNGEVYAANSANGGSLVVLNSTLAEETRRDNLGTWVQLKGIAPPPPTPPTATRPLEWSLFYQ